MGAVVDLRRERLRGGGERDRSRLTGVRERAERDLEPDLDLERVERDLERDLDLVRVLGNVS